MKKRKMRKTAADLIPLFSFFPTPNYTCQAPKSSISCRLEYPTRDTTMHDIPHLSMRDVYPFFSFIFIPPCLLSILICNI